jgi:hypothetical protein
VNRILLLEAICVPVVELIVWSGMTLENKKKVVEGITRVLEEVGIPSRVTPPPSSSVKSPKKIGLPAANFIRSDSRTEDPNLEYLRHIARRNRGLEYCHKIT